MTPLALASARPRALQNAATFELRRNAKNDKDDLGKVEGGVEVRLRE